MSGHNKWSTIKHRKGAQDAKRSRLFTKYIREITIAAKLGGGDLNGNPRLRSAVLSARGVSMPNDNIERAIKRGTGELEGVNYEEVMFEGYAPGGVALIIECLSDNRNRTTAEIRHLLSKNNGNLGTSGSVLHQFNRKGVITVVGDAINEDQLMEAALELDGFEDLKMDDGEAYVYTSPNKAADAADALTKAGFTVQETKVAMVPSLMVAVEGKTAEQIMRLVDNIEDNDDVQNVWHNAEISDEELERILQ